jgi:hypothetical protein
MLKTATFCTSLFSNTNRVLGVNGGHFECFQQEQLDDISVLQFFLAVLVFGY